MAYCTPLDTINSILYVTGHRKDMTYVGKSLKDRHDKYLTNENEK